MIKRLKNDDLSMNNSASISKTCSRNSNIEAMRIIAMFMILMLHVNNFSIGEPSTLEAVEQPLPTFARCFFESIALISVNLFVLISGWFSIRFSLKRLVAFVFQSVFIITAIYIVGLALGLADVNEIQIEECLFMAPQKGWFIKAYIGLMLLSPALNYFVDRASRKEFATLLTCLFVFQTVYACFVNGAQFIQLGYSTFSFVGLYLLARYVRLYGNHLINNAYKFCFAAFIGYVAWGYLPVRFGVMRLYYLSLHYTNPINIALALGVLLLAIKARPRCNRLVNYIASSTFAVYLCHMCNTWTATSYKHTSIELFHSYSGLKYLAVITAFMLAVFILSILVDQPRKFVWAQIAKRFTSPY